MLRFALFTATLALVGCATPTSGTYEIVTDSTTSDCPSADDTGSTGDETTTLDIEVSEDKSTVTLEDTLECPLTGTSFECSDESVTDYNDLGAGDAVMTITSETTGNWVSSSKIDGTSTLTIACEGADCETFGITNCSASSEWTGTLQE